MDFSAKFLLTFNIHVQHVVSWVFFYCCLDLHGGMLLFHFSRTIWQALMLEVMDDFNLLIL